MRKLSMKSKRGKSETGSDNDSEENGVGVKAVEDDTPEHEASMNKSKIRKGRRSQSDSNKQNDEKVTEDSASEQENGSLVKKRKKDATKASTSGNQSDAEEEYEVLKVVGQRTIKGRRQFLVRWKGYDEDSDTWEQEKNLNCPLLIEEYLAENADSSGTDKVPKTPKTAKDRKEVERKETTKAKATPRIKKKSVIESEDDNEGKVAEKDAEGTKEFEVEKILEVHFHKKTNKRDFLIRWKGFSAAEDTWEPEENLNCPHLISKFLDKLENVKKTDLRELRTNPTHTKRFTLMSSEGGRRLSRRNINKQRATYHQCDE